MLKAIKRSGGKDNYWQFRPFLPRETRDYIPKLIAAIYIMNYAEEHNIFPSKEEHIFNEEIDTLHIKRQLNFILEILPLYQKKFTSLFGVKQKIGHLEEL